MATSPDSPASGGPDPNAPATPLTGGPAEVSDKVRETREILQKAQAEGKTLRAYFRLSGPGWLQSAITLGGGSLAGSLFLGALGGVSMLWLQLVAIVFGVIMLSAISYVTLSTGRRPFEAINTEINPALGWGWLIATAMANMIFCMPQFSLCYDALDNNLWPLLTGSTLGNENSTKWTCTLIIFACASFFVLLNVRQGAAAKVFDIFLKGLIGMIVLCFVGVTVLLATQGQVDFGAVLAGLIPDLSQWGSPAGQLGAVVDKVPAEASEFWTTKLVTSQRSVMIAAAATAVGINMTFLLPYSMLARGWDKPFRGLARFDLSTGMAIPFVLVTGCVVIASATSFHNKIDDQLASNDLAVMSQSATFSKVVGGVELVADENTEGGWKLVDDSKLKGDLVNRINMTLGDQADSTSGIEKLQMIAALPEEEKRIASALAKRDAFQLSQTLSPLLGEGNAKLVFGLGVFGMGFSTIIILMLINGYVFREMLSKPNANGPFIAGVIVAGISGASWVALWTDPDLKFWLAIFASTFAVMLLPIAYITFFLMMNSRRILGDEMPTGGRRWGWNIAMGASVIGALIAAGTSIYGKAIDPNEPWQSFPTIMTLLIVYTIAVIAGFWHHARHRPAA